MATVVAFLIVAGVLAWLVYRRRERPGLAAVKAAGDAQIMCPHCQTRGQVITQSAREKRGISGGKVVGALVTLGISVLATGLSRKQHYTRLACSNCGMSWLAE